MKKFILMLGLIFCISRLTYADRINPNSNNYGWQETSTTWQEFLLDLNQFLRVNISSQSVDLTVVIDSTTHSITVYQGTDWVVVASSVDFHGTVYPGDADFPIYDNGNSITVDCSSPTALVTIYAGQTIPVDDAGGSLTIDCSSPTAYNTVFPGVAFPVTDNGGSFTVDTTSPTFYATVFPGVNFPVIQETIPWNVSESTVNIRYEILDSTYVYRNFYANGNFTVTFDVKAISCYSQGGNSTISWDSGDAIDIWDGIPFDDVPIDETFDQNVTFTCTLSVPTTFSIYVRGIAKRKN